MKKPFAVGESLPDFELPMAMGESEELEPHFFQLSAQKGKNLILAFYPADFSPVCSSQIALYNELIDTFTQYNAVLYGISVDGIFCHNAFKKYENIQLNLLSDFQPKGAVSELLHVYDDINGFCQRAIYVLDKDGFVRYSYIAPLDQNPGAKEILETLKNIQNEQ